MAVTKKTTGNKTTELIIGSGISKLNRTIVDAKATVAEFDKLIVLAEEQSLKIVNAEEKLAELDLELKNRKAQNEIEVSQAYRRNEKLFVADYLTSNSLVALEEEKLDKLLERADKKDEEIKKMVSEAVHAATGSMGRAHSSEIALLKLEYEKKEVGNVAEISQLKKQIEFLEGQLAHWKQMLEKQVEAETTRAASKAVGSINVGNPTGK